MHLISDDIVKTIVEGDLVVGVNLICLICKTSLFIIRAYIKDTNYFTKDNIFLRNKFKLQSIIGRNSLGKSVSIFDVIMFSSVNPELVIFSILSSLFFGGIILSIFFNLNYIRIDFSLFLMNILENIKVIVWIIISVIKDVLLIFNFKLVYIEDLSLIFFKILIKLFKIY
jgi:hypothetical protein